MSDQKESESKSSLAGSKRGRSPLPLPLPLPRPSTRSQTAEERKHITKRNKRRRIDSAPINACLYDDMLGLVFGWLKLRDRVRAAQVSHRWNAIAEQPHTSWSLNAEQSKHDDTITLSTLDNRQMNAKVAAIAQSPIARHHLHRLYIGTRTELTTRDPELVLRPLASSLRALFHLVVHNQFDHVSTDPTLRFFICKFTMLRTLMVSGAWQRNTEFVRALLVPGCPLVHLQDVGRLSLDADLVERLIQHAPHICHMNVLLTNQNIPFMLGMLNRLPPLVTLKIRSHAISDTIVIRSALFPTDMDRSRLELIRFRHSHVDTSMVAWLMDAPRLEVIEFVKAKRHGIPDFSRFSHPVLRRFAVYTMRHSPQFPTHSAPTQFSALTPRLAESHMQRTR